MINISNINSFEGKRTNLEIASSQNLSISADHLTLLPALIDPHVHFRIPGHEYKEDWKTAAQASICGGCTTVFDMPNTSPSTITLERLQEKKQLIDKQLAEVGIPLRYKLFFGADKNHLEEIYRVKSAIVGIKIFMGCSTGDLLVDDDSSLHAVFAIAAAHDLLVAVHAEDEHMIHERKAHILEQVKGGIGTDYKIHSQIRNPEVAAKAVDKAITLARIYNTRLYILHVSTADEIQLIKTAKRQGLPVFAETTPHHLFLNDQAYEKLSGRAVMNPPLRSSPHQLALFEAINEQVIDTIGSDHAPHTIEEKNKAYGLCPSGVPGIETLLPLLLNAHKQGLLSLSQIVSLTSQRVREIFNLPDSEDWVLVDLNKKMLVDEKKLKTKCGWSPFAGMQLTGWPVYTILKDTIYDLEKMRGKSC